jgi:hypothetical protein
MAAGILSGRHSDEEVDQQAGAPTAPSPVHGSQESVEFQAFWIKSAPLLRVKTSIRWLFHETEVGLVVM